MKKPLAIISLLLGCALLAACAGDPPAATGSAQPQITDTPGVLAIQPDPTPETSATNGPRPVFPQPRKPLIPLPDAGMTPDFGLPDKDAVDALSLNERTLDVRDWYYQPLEDGTKCLMVRFSVLKDALALPDMDTLVPALDVQGDVIRLSWNQAGELAYELALTVDVAQMSVQETPYDLVCPPTIDSPDHDLYVPLYGVINGLGGGMYVNSQEGAAYIIYTGAPAVTMTQVAGIWSTDMGYSGVQDIIEGNTPLSDSMEAYELYESNQYRCIRLIQNRDGSQTMHVQEGTFTCAGRLLLLFIDDYSEYQRAAGADVFETLEEHEPADGGLNNALYMGSVDKDVMTLGLARTQVFKIY